MAYLRNKKDFETGLLLSQSLSFKAYNMFITAIYFWNCKKYTIFISSYTADATNKDKQYSQARNQLGTPGGAKIFLRGAQIFLTMSNSFKIYPTNFSRGAKNILGGASTPASPLVMGLTTVVTARQNY